MLECLQYDGKHRCTGHRPSHIADRNRNCLVSAHAIREWGRVERLFERSLDGGRLIGESIYVGRFDDRCTVIGKLDLKSVPAVGESYKHGRMRSYPESGVDAVAGSGDGSVSWGGHSGPVVLRWS